MSAKKINPYAKHLESIRDGGGNRIGVGSKPDLGDDRTAITMTGAAECMFGTSGKDSPRAKQILRGAITNGYLSFAKQGRSTWVSITEKGYDLITPEH